MKVIVGPASEQLGEEIAALLNVEMVPVISKIFPDGESYIRLEGDVENERVVIVQSTSPPQDTRLVQLALIVDAARRNNARKIECVVPYLAYSRQDKAFLQGEAVSIEILAQIFKEIGVDSLITVNVHEKNMLSKFPFPARTVSAVPLLADYFKRRGFEKPFALAPDKGAMWLAEEAASILSGKYGALEKHRDLYTGKVSTETKTLGVKGKTVIIFDDIISTGGTIVAATEILKRLKAERIYVACVHPLLI